MSLRNIDRNQADIIEACMIFCGKDSLGVLYIVKVQSGEAWEVRHSLERPGKIFSLLGVVLSSRFPFAAKPT